MRATANDRHNTEDNRENSHGSHEDDHGTRPNFAHLFVGLNGVSGFFPGRLVDLLGGGAHKHMRLKQVSLVRGFSFFRIRRGRTAGMIGTLGHTD